LASRVLGEAALEAGLAPVVSETHGMAQRGGIVVSAVVLGGVKSPIISPGEADVILGFEALETFRALSYAHPKTLVIANTAAFAPYTVATGQAKYPDVPRMLRLMGEHVGGLLVFDAGESARRAGSPLAVNMVVLGALAATSRLPLGADDLLRIIRTSTKANFLEINLQAFQAGIDAARDTRNWIKPPGGWH
jgi:indolepyruvate ferredoxin oxidoreductase beta subunit